MNSGIRQTSLFDGFQTTMETFEKPTIQILSNSVPSIPAIPTTLAEELFFEMSEDHPNYEVFRKVVSGNFSREEILREYKPLGLTAKLENSRGLPDMAAKRKLNMGQFFTPMNVAEALTKVTALDYANNLIIFDNCCGCGNLLNWVYEDNKIFAIEKDKYAYSIAKELYPKAEIINDDLLNQYQMKGTVDAVLINPPFSLQLEQKNIRLENTSWGKLGPSSSIESHIAALEIALKKGDLVIGAIVPTSFFTNEKTYSFEKWVNKTNKKQILRIDLPSEAFQEYGTSWECSIVVYASRYYGSKDEAFHFTPKTMEDMDETLYLWSKTQTYLNLRSRVLEYSRHYDSPYYNPSLEDEFKFIEQKEEPVKAITTPKLPLEFKNVVKVCINPNGSGLRYKPSDMLTGLMLHSQIKDSGSIYGSHNILSCQNWDWDLRLASILTDSCCRTPEQYIDNLEGMGVHVEVDQAVNNWLAKKRREYERNKVPYEKVQYNEETGEWVELHETDGIRAKLKHLYEQQEKKLKATGIDWLWDYQEDDIIRMSIKKSTLYAAEQALGKTRTMIGLGLQYGCKYNLIVVEPKLTNEALKEFKKLGVEDVQVIESESDIYSKVNGRKEPVLKKFNIISYRKLWSPLHKKTKRTYAQAVKKLVNFIAVDEAHKIKKETKQGKAVLSVCQKMKHILLTTGTPIGNYPRNIYPLLVAGWGDGTQLNEYGYINPMKTAYSLMPGTRAFADTFIRIEWVTEQFAQTLESGAKAREIPVIKDLEAWAEIIDFKMIRRRRAEPMVRKHMPDLNPVFHDHFIMPDLDHITYYKYWLENFANWFREQLRLKNENPDHNIETAIILAHLTKLNFASTIPQSANMTKDNTGLAWTYKTTQKQEKVKELVKAAVENGEKVIVFSGRPDFQSYMQRALDKEGIKGYIFTGEQTVKNRNILLEDFKINPDISVLYATTTCGDTGLNIPEASTVIFADQNWTPSKTRQAYSRILRVEQEREPHIHFLYNKGMIDEYMLQLCNMKTEGIDQAIDGHNADEFDADSWMSYRDFSYKMLKELGLI